MEHDEVLTDEEFFTNAVNRNTDTVTKDETYVNLLFN
jgi:hypothetical protein